MRGVKSVAIYKPNSESTFEVGAKIMFGKEKTEKTVTSIRIGFFNKVVVTISDGMELAFTGFPISYEKITK